jgi:hypothetical protein
LGLCVRATADSLSIWSQICLTLGGAFQLDGASAGIGAEFTSKNTLEVFCSEILVLFSSAEGEGSNDYHNYVKTANYGNVVM